MFWGGSWELAHYRRQNDEDFTLRMFLPPPPTGRDQIAIFQPDFGIAINSATTGEHLEAAKDFLEWLSRPETQENMAALLPGFYPLRHDIDRGRIADGLTGTDPFLAVVDDPSTAFRWDLPADGIPSGRLLLRRALKRLIPSPAPSDSDADTDMPTDIAEPRQEANAIQRGLASWYRPAQIPPTCLPAPPR